VIDEPGGAVHVGGDVAGPVFAALAANVLRAKNVPPDSTVTHIIIPENYEQENL